MKKKAGMTGFAWLQEPCWTAGAARVNQTSIVRVELKDTLYHMAQTTCPVGAGSIGLENMRQVLFWSYAAFQHARNWIPLGQPNWMFSRASWCVYTARMFCAGCNFCWQQ